VSTQAFNFDYMNYKIRTGNIREDHNLYYEEGFRIITIHTTATHSYFGNHKIVLHLDSLKKWDTRMPVSLDEFHTVLVRIYGWLRDQGYDIKLE
jgi:hypothetical protein